MDNGPWPRVMHAVRYGMNELGWLFVPPACESVQVHQHTHTHTHCVQSSLGAVANVTKHTTLQYTTVHYTTLQYTTLHYTTVTFPLLHFSNTTPHDTCHHILAPNPTLSCLVPEYSRVTPHLTSQLTSHLTSHLTNTSRTMWCCINLSLTAAHTVCQPYSQPDRQTDK